MITPKYFWNLIRNHFMTRGMSNQKRIGNPLASLRAFNVVAIKEAGGFW